ncbi:serine/threonine-protein phosphatase 2A activator-like [Daktulosphaira vitifoliae]|uniref:serine/threonine-protein phosphatase 2A activator-like n=1 Tax=Daktulosphaira vitifoliae TaxID=58002 RepID=UPI0021A9B66A|nr:serine/threonine-protein phosphatase 2A activator-like [Daktulosphaira vitifoliae]
MDYFDDQEVMNDLKIEKLGRCIFHRRDMFDWESSEAINDVITFVSQMNEEIKGTIQIDNNNIKHTSIPWSSKVNLVLVILQNVYERLIDHPSDLNNRSALYFYELHDYIRSEGHAVIVQMYGDKGKHLTVELPVYFKRSFGDPDKMQYGIEHELSFIMFLIGLYKLNFLSSSDGQFTVCLLFNRYKLKASNNFGNFGLSDFHFLSFLWGSGQLIGNIHNIIPISIDSYTEAKIHKNNYIFMTCLNMIHNYEKKEPFWKHSYQLWNLKALSSWEKVNKGLMSMFKKSILSNYDVAKHLYFGELLKFRKDINCFEEQFYNRLEVQLNQSNAEEVEVES